MKIVTFDAPIFISKLEAHDQIKQKLINAIDNIGRFSIIYKGHNQRITHTDWHLKSPVDKLYWPIVEEHLVKITKNVCAKLNYDESNITNYWFQWYEKGDFHTEHSHPGCMFSNVYYLKLNSENPKTSFSLNNQKFEVSVSEGDVISFPSFLNHESLPNLSDEPKIVIAFNTNYWIKFHG